MVLVAVLSPWSAQWVMAAVGAGQGVCGGEPWMRDMAQTCERGVVAWVMGEGCSKCGLMHT